MIASCHPRTILCVAKKSLSTLCYFDEQFRVGSMAVSCYTARGALFFGVIVMEINDSKILDSFLEAMSSDADWTVLDDVVDRFLACLESGVLRCAVRREDGVWEVEPRVKQLILNVFRLGHLEERSETCFQFCDKHNLWPNMAFLPERRIRIVPGGTTVRRGAYVASGVTIMPPAYVNIGAWIGEGSMIDSHALVGSCAQVGSRCHISAAAQLGGVLEPVGQLPVIIEDGAFVGGNTGIYEGTHVGREAVIGSGTMLTRSTPVYDLVHGTVIYAEDGVLHIPERAVVVPGARAVKSAFGEAHGLSLYAPMIVKYRDEKTGASVCLEEALRQI